MTASTRVTRMLSEGRPVLHRERRALASRVLIAELLWGRHDDQMRYRSRSSRRRDRARACTIEQGGGHESSADANAATRSTNMAIINARVRVVVGAIIMVVTMVMVISYGQGPDG